MNSYKHISNVSIHISSFVRHHGLIPPQITTGQSECGTETVSFRCRCIYDAFKVYIRCSRLVQTSSNCSSSRPNIILNGELLWKSFCFGNVICMFLWLHVTNIATRMLWFCVFSHIAWVCLKDQLINLIVIWIITKIPMTHNRQVACLKGKRRFSKHSNVLLFLENKVLM